jgi:hypothetical protein
MGLLIYAVLYWTVEVYAFNRLIFILDYCSIQGSAVTTSKTN